MSRASAAERPPGNSLQRKMLAGATWMVAFRFLDRLIGMVSMIVLARLMTPDVFGLVAMATTVAGMLELFSEFGADAALIRNPKPTVGHFNTAWSLELVKNLMLGLLLVALALPASWFFESPALESVVYAIAGIWMLKGFTNIGIVNFRRDLQFEKEFTFLLSARLVATLLTLLAAWYFRDHRALLIGMLGHTVLKVALSYAMHPFRPKFSFSRLREIFRFSRWIMLQSVFHGLAMRTPNLLIGHVAGASAVGLFTLSQEISELASTEISAPIRRALYPGFSKLANDARQLSQRLLEAHSIVLLLTLPIPIIIGFLASLLVPLLFGEQWLAAVPLMQVHALLGVLKTLGTHSHVIYMALNQPKWTSLVSCIHLVILVPVALVLVRAVGPVGAVYALIVSLLISLIIDYTILCRLLPLNVGSFLHYCWRIVVASGVAAALLYAEKQLLPTAVNPIDQILQIILMGLSSWLIYVISLLLLWHLSGRPHGSERMVLDYLKQWLPQTTAK